MTKTKERELRNLYNELELVIRRNFINISSAFTVEDAIEKEEYHTFFTSNPYVDTARVVIYFCNGIVEVEVNFSGFRTKNIGEMTNHMHSVVKSISIKETLDSIINEINKIKNEGGSK